MRTIRLVLGASGVVGVLAFAGCSVETQPSNVICVPDQSNICTDCPRPTDPADKQSYAGRHTCAHDGKSFGACQVCAPVVAVSSSNFHEVPEPTDDGGVAEKPPPGTPTIDAACANKLAVLAGKDDPDDPFTYAAVYQGTSFKVFSTSGAPMRSPAAFVANGASVLAVYRSKNDAIVATTFSNGLWSAAMGITGATSNGAPSLTTWGTTIKAIFRQDDGRFHVANLQPATGWADGIELVGSSTAAAPPGVSEPWAVSTGVPGLAGAAVMVGYTDNVKGLYRQEWHGETWFPTGIKASTVKAAAFRPAIIVMSSGKYDLISMYVGDDGALHASTRTSKDLGSMWSADAVANDKAIPLEGVNGIGLPNGRALIVYRDAEKKGQFIVFDPTQTPSWSEPAPLIADANPVLASTPQLVADPCGAEASVAVVAEDSLSVLRYAGKDWKGPYKIGTPASVTFATIVAAP